MRRVVAVHKRVPGQIPTKAYVLCKQSTFLPPGLAQPQDSFFHSPALSMFCLG